MWEGGLLGITLLVILVLFIGGPLLRTLAQGVRAVFRRVRGWSARRSLPSQLQWRIEAAGLLDAQPGSRIFRLTCSTRSPAESPYERSPTPRPSSARATPPTRTTWCGGHARCGDGRFRHWRHPVAASRGTGRVVRRVRPRDRRAAQRHRARHQPGRAVRDRQGHVRSAARRPHGDTRVPADAPGDRRAAGASRVRAPRVRSSSTRWSRLESG